MPSAKELIQLYSSLDNSTERSNLKILWQEIADFVFPRRNDVIVKKTKGSRRTDKVFDSTAIHSNELLAATLQGSLTSNSVFWFNIRLEDEVANDDEEVKAWLDRSTRKMYKAFNDSAFRLEIHEMFLDITSVGTGCLLTEESKIEGSGFNGLMFRSYFVGQDFVIRENAEGIVDTVIRKVLFTPRQAKQKFGNKAGKEVLAALKKNTEQEFSYLHVVMPIKDYGAGGFGNPKWTFTDIYISIDDEFMSSKSGYFEFPYIVPRWAKATGEMYGRSPSFTALPDIRTLNTAVSYMLQAWAKDIKPSRLVPDSLGVDIDDVPGTNIPVPLHMIEAIQKGVLTSGARWEVSAEERQQLRTAIKETYFTDQIQLQKQAQMTATESTIIFELMQRLLGPIFGRLELQLSPMVERTFGVMLRAGEFDPIPEQLADGIEIQYVGPLARSQRMSEINAIEKWFQQIVPIAGVKPDILDVPDFDEITRDMGRLLGVNEKYVRSTDAVKKTRDDRQEEVDQAQTTEEASVAADALSKIGRIPG